MKKRVLIVLLIALALTIGSVLVSWANVNPPPVNQFLGMPDTTFSNMTEAGCRSCHNTTPPEGIPVDTTFLPTRHHNLIGQTYPCPSAATNDTCPTPGTYECLTCHTVQPNGTLAPFRDCLICHTGGTPTVHHTTPQSLAQNCKACHGLLDNPLDSHFIPTYPKSMVTPRAGLGSTTGPLGTGQGGCAYCHRPGTDTSTGVSISIFSNGDTHHSAIDSAPLTGVANTCLYCHGLSMPFDIRQCEKCHGVASLHNIQTNSNGTCSISGTPCSVNSQCPTGEICSGTIVPGQESPYYGHIGSNTDCNGCHLNTSASAGAPYSGPVIPNVSGLTAYNFTTGTDTIITVSGSAFTNTVQGPTGPIELKSNVVLTAANGSTTTLTPLVITESSMDVTIPGTLAAGNYDLRAVKADKASNLVVVSVKPAVVINSATCNNGVVTITGSGFSQYVNAVDSGTNVKLGANACSVNSWSDTQIVANCGTCSGTVGVSSVFGTASKTVVDLTPTNKPPVAEAGPNKSVKRNTSVKFDGSASIDPDGTINSYQWNFGDGTSGTGKVVYHKYTRRGTFTVTLKVTDNDGATGTDTARVTVR